MFFFVGILFAAIEKKKFFSALAALTEKNMWVDFRDGKVFSPLVMASPALYRAVDRVYSKHSASIRKIVSNKRVWVATDEWTDSQVKKDSIHFTFSFLQGHAIINISIGCGPQSWVVATCTLQCKGKNDGVERTV